jgi:hypothetical protein
MVVNAQDYGFEPSETPRTDRSVSSCSHACLFLLNRNSIISFMSLLLLLLWLSILAGDSSALIFFIIYHSKN